MPGPAPEPTALKLARGNPGKRALNDREPKPKRGRPRCPDWLDRTGRAKWREVVPQLDAMGVLTKIDGSALARYCHFHSWWRKIDDGITDANDEWRAFGNMMKVAQELRRLEQEFGMTPSSRTRIHAEGKEQEVDAFEKFMSKTG